ncbi:hypothetical protein SLH46_17650 [Draconibacterium sp. IB214405]|uniref:hypothetical protein n=1 Tax=Draconibacterium sp. IB214405 TaxID=3097352 RepID=UPI002A0AE285|nr:hypothetical protein [Draconibacterium sp. IB214405]MDX8341028.1 hypothetical protein [Draconibacterium sp. IB214405]
MKKIVSNIYKMLLGFVMAIAVLSCGEMFNNPTIDKDTGEDINLLIVDFNFFTTRMNFKLLDADDNAQITKSAKIWFTGDNANDIVNFSGEKNSEYLTEQGEMELTIDPNVEITASSPFNYGVHVEVDGYQAFTQGIEIQSEGKKTYELQLVKKSNDETLTGTEDDDSFIFGALVAKSVSVDDKSYKVQFGITKADMIQFTDTNGKELFSSVAELEAAYANSSDKANFLQLTISNKKTDYNAGIDVVNVEGEKQSVLFKKLESGSFGSLVIDGKVVKSFQNGGITASCSYLSSPVPDLFGFTGFETDSWSFTGTSKWFSTPDFSYLVAEASLDICTTGANIKFSSNAQSSFSIDADIYDADGSLIKSTNFKGKFPETFTLENVPSGAATFVFRTNNPAFAPISDLSVTDLCSGTYKVDVDKADGYEEYQIVLKAICPDNPTIAIAPTYSGQIRIKDSNDAWQGIDMEGGIVDVLAKPGEVYQLRLLWEDEWETTDFSTQFDANGNYINTTDSKVVTEELPDGRIRFLIEHEFEQNICDDMGW